jgi:hypothetical protein
MTQRSDECFAFGAAPLPIEGIAAGHASADGQAGLLTWLTETGGLTELPKALRQLEPRMAVDCIFYGKPL